MKAACFLICLFLSAFVIGCNQQQSSPPQMPAKQSTQSVGRMFNPLRKELGLIPIGDNWTLYKSDNIEEHWVIRKGSPSGKTVFKDSAGQITKEEDYYYSGLRYTDRHDYGSEFISALYDYQNKQIVLGYSGTNKAVKSDMSSFRMTINGGSTDVVGAITVLKKVAANWPDGPK